MDFFSFFAKIFTNMGGFGDKKISRVNGAGIEKR